MNPKKILFIILSISILSMTSCEESDIFLDENEFSLKVNETISFGLEENSHSLLYNKLIEDSLCREGFVCIQWGRIMVELIINNDTTVILGIGDISRTTAIQTFEYNGYSIRLIDRGLNGKQEIILKISPL